MIVHHQGHDGYQGGLVETHGGSSCLFASRALINPVGAQGASAEDDRLGKPYALATTEGVWIVDF